MAASLFFHALVLAFLGWRSAPHLSLREAEPKPRDIQLTLVRPMQAQATPLPSTSHASESAPRAAALPRPAPTIPATAPTVAHPAVAGPAAPTTGPANGSKPSPAAGAEAGGDLKGFLRAGVGCGQRDAVGLTRAERERCDEKAGEVARNAPTIDRIPAEKRAYYDAVQAAYVKMHAPAPQVNLHNGDNLGVQERWAGEPGSHLPGFGCQAPLGNPRGYKSYHDKPPNSLKLGFLPCFITPPSGYLTEEADVQQPASAKEVREDARHMRDLDPPSTPPGK